MSKKSKRAKQRQNRLGQPYIQVLKQLLNHAQHQISQGDFTGAIDTCNHLRRTLPKQPSVQVEILALLGLAHAMLQHFYESYDLFSEALTIDPTNAELWYNRGLASQCVTRVGQSVRDFERAIALAGNYPNEMTRRFTEELAKSRQGVAEAMETNGEQITLDQYIEREDLFMHAMQLMRKDQWKESEQAFCQLTKMGGRLPQYWGNLGVSLMMQSRYDEAEAALKKALDIDPTYPVARDNLMKLPQVRRLGPSRVETIDLLPMEDYGQTITFFESRNDHPSPTIRTRIEKVGNTVKGTRAQRGQLPPRYRFFLNPYEDMRFTSCPQCHNKTGQRKLLLVIHIDPHETLIWDRTCRYCVHCDLLIVHRDQLEEQLAGYFTQRDPEIIGNDYVVLGTLEKPKRGQELEAPLSARETLERLHDFKETISFQWAPV